MLMLEIVTKATMADIQTSTVLSKYPIILNSGDIFPHLKPEDGNSFHSHIIRPVSGWQISSIDAHIIESGTHFANKLSQKLKSPKSFTRDEFLSLLNSFLQKNGEKIGVSVDLDSSSESGTRQLLEKLGFLIGADLAGLISECCMVLDMWDLLEMLILKCLVKHSVSSSLIRKLVEKKKSYLLCLCIKNIDHLQPLDILSVMKFFLSSDSSNTSKEVRKFWESQVLLAIEKVTHKRHSMAELAKHASISLMAAHDDFSSLEQGLHHLLASPHIDGPALSWAIAELEGLEVIRLTRYLGKWLAKYERFPMIGGPWTEEDVAKLGLEGCKWIPSLEAVARCFGLVVDEHFSYLVLQPEGFRGELKVIEEKVTTLTLEARLCCDVAYLIEDLKLLNA